MCVRARVLTAHVVLCMCVQVLLRAHVCVASGRGACVEVRAPSMCALVWCTCKPTIPPSPLTPDTHTHTPCRACCRVGAKRQEVLLERLRTFSELALSSAEAKGAPGAGLAALIHKLQVRAWSCARR